MRARAWRGQAENGPGWWEEGRSKVFFFEKKNQKTLIIWFRGCGSAEPKSQKFLFLSFKKEDLRLLDEVRKSPAWAAWLGINGL
jgi:hypothetical protein